MSERHYTFAVEELKTITCKCPHCGNVIAFSLDTDPKFGVPQGCSTCNESLPDLARAFVHYREFYRTVAQSKLPIRIQSCPVAEPER
jgi:hypothetical protein